MIPRYELNSAASLLVVDIQERLLPAMEPALSERAVRGASLLVELAQVVGAQVFYSEQYPKGLGATVEAVREPLERSGATRYEKTRFDAVGAPEFAPLLPKLGHRVFLCGMETHICVLGTAQTLRSLGHEVILPMDAVASRTREHWSNGLELMRAGGVIVANVESILFATLQDASHPEFKRFSRMIR
jgi:nicotinamidase-related amidase